MMDLEEAIKRGLLSKEGIEAEMSWLRCIDMDDDKSVRSAAIQIKFAIIEAKREEICDG